MSTVKEKLINYLKTRKTPVTIEQVSTRMFCSKGTASEAMNELIKEGLVKEVLVATKNRYVKGIIAK
jgi:predicted transcriptional regulator